MKILIDECTPRALKKHLVNHGHECLTVQEAGWAGMQNGELLSLRKLLLTLWSLWIQTSATSKT